MRKKIGINIRKSIVLSFLLSLVLFQPLVILACGMSIVEDLGMGNWTYGNDSAEQSFINYENGEEKLIISRKFTNYSQDTVWIIPVPAPADSINVDVLSETPIFSGYDVKEEAIDRLDEIQDYLLYTQLYTYIPKLILDARERLEPLSAGIGAADSDMIWGGFPGSAENAGVTVHERLEKNGMVAEVLSADNSSSLYTYLNAKGLKVQKDSIPILQDYIGEEFSFVTSWVSSSAGNTIAKGLLMTFPTDKIFYPLKPESATPGEGFPETITVVGHVSPKLYNNIKDHTDVNYFYSPEEVASKDFFTSKNGFGFTQIEINVKPNKLTEDLYISELPPLQIMNAQFASLFPTLYGVILHLLISLLSTYLVLRHLLPRKEDRPHFLIFGIVNSLTLIGTIVSSRLFLKEHRVKFVISFSITFIVLTYIVTKLLSFSLSV